MSKKKPPSTNLLKPAGDYDWLLADVVKLLEAARRAWARAANSVLNPGSGADQDSTAAYFPLPWSHYVKLLSVDDEGARRFYEQEALRGGWSVRQLDRQIGSQFIGRQKRLRIGDEWYRIDLLFFHRLLRCLVVIDLKIGKFTHADAGQMHLYLNYAREHWTQREVLGGAT